MWNNNRLCPRFINCSGLVCRKLQKKQENHRQMQNPEQTVRLITDTADEKNKVKSSSRSKTGFKFHFKWCKLITTAAESPVCDWVVMWVNTVHLEVVLVTSHRPTHTTRTHGLRYLHLIGKATEHWAGVLWTERGGAAFSGRRKPHVWTFPQRLKRQFCWHKS